jgi:hypothetical protein
VAKLNDRTRHRVRRERDLKREDLDVLFFADTYDVYRSFSSRGRMPCPVRGLLVR